ncbi:hypothetical protein H4S02_000806 [Coemansia sp. RSA 2611]|nr:hypothetical protein H4S02_000806 [Coemansia sp. RSA 2611]
MAYRKRSLDLPGPAEPKHARSAALAPIRSLAALGGHERLPSLLSPTSPPSSASSENPPLRLGDPSLSLAAIRVSSPPGNPDQSAQRPLQALSAPAADGVKVARNWSRDETLSLVRAIGRHYESLKRCKTNQERSNVWHRIHKEHSSQFPGRSKKASQDRWGKVLSDYKDVMVHNKEKGAARWTFDFFKEVAAIVEGDAQFDLAATSPPLFSPQPSRFPDSRFPDSRFPDSRLPDGRFPESRLSDSRFPDGRFPDSRPAAEDLGAYSFGAAAAPSSVRAAPHPPSQLHRMSEPNFSGNYSMLRAQKLSPVELGPAAAASERRTSYPQMQAQALAPAYARGPADAKPLSYQRHSIQVLSPPPPNGSSVTPSTLSYTRNTPVQPAASPVPDEPERACRFVLDMLDAQVRRIDAQQESLVQLRSTTQDAIARVEHVLQRFARP